MFAIKKISLFPALLLASRPNGRVEKVIRSYHVPEITNKKIAYENIRKRIEEGSYNQSSAKAILLSPVYRIAISTTAFLALIFLLHLFISTEHFENQTIQANAIGLPDHSRVVLNTNSTISYPTHWWKRQVKLQGTAYFEVKKGKTFTVKTSKGNIHVLGTRFLVDERSNELLVTCYEGKVMLDDHINQWIVNKGQSLKVDRNGNIHQTDINEQYPETACYKKAFSQDKLSTVAASLEEFFQITIRLNTPQDRYFTGKLETPDIETALQIVCRSLNLDYSRINNETIVINQKD